VKREFRIWLGLGLLLWVWLAPSWAQGLPHQQGSAGSARRLVEPSWEAPALVATAMVSSLAVMTGYLSPVIAAVAVGGALGSTSRYLVSHSIGSQFEGELPYGTLAVNILGSFAFGVIGGATALRAGDAPDSAWLDMVTTGFLGGFTTFSLFAHETVDLAHAEGIGPATAYTALSVGLSVAALLLGEVVGSGGVLP
jgi:fluoride exporter